MTSSKCVKMQQQYRERNVTTQNIGKHIKINKKRLDLSIK